MRRLTLNPKSAVHVPYTLSSDVVVVRAHSTDVVTLRVLDSVNAAAYQKGSIFYSLAVSQHKLDHEMAVRLPSLGEWFLTIENFTGSSADVDFEVIEQRYGGSPTGAQGILSGSIFR